MIRKVFATGGIGSGVLFKLEGNHTIGRNESRLGCLTDYHDYCKQHIILHYIAGLTEAAVYAIGMVGDDAQGEELLDKMKTAGILTDFVGVAENARTMQAVCFQYPDGSGGNITTSNSACELVTPAYVERCSRRIDQASLVVSVPEVPLASRIRLLEIGRQRGAFNVASFLSAEAVQFERLGGFPLCDLLSINIDEAGAVARAQGEAGVLAAKAAARAHVPFLIVTAGSRGAFAFENGRMTAVESIRVPVVSTAGAGDALLAGTIAGMIGGKNFLESVRLGSVLAALAVQSKDAIAQEVSQESIRSFIEKRNRPCER